MSDMDNNNVEIVSTKKTLKKRNSMSREKSMDNIFEYIENNSESIVEDLCELCRQPSISTTDIGIEQMAQLMQKRLEKTGFKVKRHETSHNPILTGFLKGISEKTILFYNHYDVQPPDPEEEWETPPFEPSIRDGHIFARGSTDNKGNIMSRLAAFEAFIAVRGELPCSVKYVIEGNEEMSSPSFRHFVPENKELLSADACIWEDTFREDVPVLSLGNKGMCYLELTVQTANVDFHSSHAQIYENAAWRLNWALSTMKDQEENILIEGFYDDVISLTPKEEKLVEKMKPYDGQDRKNKFEIRKFLLDLSDEELPRRHLTNPSFNLAGMNAGYTGKGRKTVVAGKASAKIDCRLVVAQTPEKIYECVRRHLDKHGFDDIKVEMLGSGSYPAKSDPESEIVKACQIASQKVYGADPVVNPFGSGSTPTWTIIKHLGIPLCSTGVGYITARTHSVNENIKIEHLIEGAKYMASICEEFSKI